MKTMILSLIVTLAGSSALASGCSFCDSPLFTTVMTSMSPASTSDGGYKSALEMAQEDAVKFVASKGQGPVSDALRAAIDAVNAKVVAAGMAAMNDNDAASMIVFVNTINAQKQ